MNVEVFRQINMVAVRETSIRDGVERSATISPCRTFRYQLARRLVAMPIAAEDLFGTPAPVAPPERRLLWIMLNPSVGNGTDDDPTLRRCADFVARWGFGPWEVGNLHAFRSPHPDVMMGAADSVGPDNDAHLLGMAGRADAIVCAWGDGGGHMGRDRQVLRMLAEHGHAGKIHTFGQVHDPATPWLTKSGQPRHPLYLPSVAPLVRWAPPCIHDPANDHRP